MMPLLHGKKSLPFILAAVLLGFLSLPSASGGNENTQNPFKGRGPWFERDQVGEIRLHLYFFWSNKCPHCKRAKPFLEKLQQEHPWVLLSELEVTENPENARRFAEMVESIGEKSRAVPALLFCGGMVQGFDREENSGTQLMKLLTQCRVDLTAYLAPPEPMPEIPARQSPSSNGQSTLVMWAVLVLVVSGAAVFWGTNRLKK